MPHEVIMPALGMAQETGLILAWRKSPGDPVKTGEVLMEVETDKAAMEVEALADGFLTEIRAGEGQEVPVGEVIAVISDSAEDVKPTPDTKTETPKQEAAPAEVPTPVRKPELEVKAVKPLAPPVQTANGKVLASPKARRLAEERGLDLGRLAKSGHPQPYRVADLEVLAAMPEAGTAGSYERITARARVEAEAFDGFCRWIASETEADTGRILACFAAGSLRAATGAADIVVQVAAPRRQPQIFSDPDRVGLKRLEPKISEMDPDLIVYDLTDSRLTDAELAAVRIPTLTVARSGSRLVVSLTAAPNRLDDEALIACLDAFAGRLEEPLRQLL
jgi:pyruvate/2-oxoglutarate dehydrogenase complex dihydrolipoamide acyltransferase (E2) component